MQTPIYRILEDKGDDVHVIEHDATVHEAVETLNSNHIGALVVVNDDLIVGMFTERDVLNRVVARRLEPHETRIDDVMSRRVVSIDPRASIEEALELMTMSRCRHLPVVDRHTLCGLVSAGDLIRWTVREQDFHISDLTLYIAHG